MATADLLGSLAPPFHMRDGVDLLISRQVDGQAGLRFLLQNPYDEEIRVDIKLPLREKIELAIGPLEVVKLDVPMNVSDRTEVPIEIVSGAPASKPVRLSTPGHLNLGRSAAGLAIGVASALLMPVAHFSWSRSGGDVSNPFQLKPEVRGRPSRTGVVTLEVLWAPGVPLSSATVARRRVGGREIRWGTAAFVVGLGAILASLFVATLQMAQPDVPFAVGTGLLLAGLCYGAWRWTWFTKPRESHIGARVGLRVTDRPHPDSSA